MLCDKILRLNASAVIAENRLMFAPTVSNKEMGSFAVTLVTWRTDGGLASRATYAAKRQRTNTALLLAAINTGMALETKGIAIQETGPKNCL
jgi:hypothetical protein